MGRGRVAGCSEFWKLHFNFILLKSGFKAIVFLRRRLPLRAAKSWKWSNGVMFKSMAPPRCWKWN
jgi:hypothetical protein